MKRDYGIDRVSKGEIRVKRTRKGEEGEEESEGNEGGGGEEEGGERREVGRG